MWLGGGKVRRERRWPGGERGGGDRKARGMEEQEMNTASVCGSGVRCVIWLSPVVMEE